MRRLLSFAAALLSIVIATSGPSFSRPKDPMNIKEGALDEIYLKVPKIATGVPVLIRPFTTEGADFGTGGEGAKNEQRAESARTMGKVAPDLLMESFKATLTGTKLFGEILPPEATSLPEKVLVVEGKFTKIDPGSRAKRYWAGFGAGKSGVQVTGTVKDASGNVLAEFTHMKNSGIGIGGGDYVKFLSDDTKDVGRDIALFLMKWATGDDLHKD
jgi:uncharacterized protein DUF4410